MNPGEQLWIFVDEQPLPRHDNIVEDQRRVDFIEASRQGMALGIGMFRVEIAAENLQAFGVHRNREGNRVVRFVGIARPVGIDQHFVRNRRQRRQGSQAAHHGPRFGFADHVKNQIGIVLLADSFGPVIILIGQSMGKAEIVATDIAIIGAGVFRPLLVGLFDHVGPIEQSDHQLGDEFGIAPHLAQRVLRPKLDVAPFEQPAVRRYAAADSCMKCARRRAPRS